MTDDRDIDRDVELARRLAAVRPPEHRPGFWADLRADLSSSTETDPGGGRGLVGHGGGVVELRDRHVRRRPHLLVAAAVAVVAMVSAGVVLATGGGDDRTDVATDPTVADDPDTTATTGTDPSGPLRPDGAPVERGVGRPLAVDPTGTFLYVAAPAPEGGFGCEGAPAEALFVERVEGDGSDRRLAVDPGLTDATGGLEVRFSDAGDIVLAPRCEGFGAGLVTGTVAGDGTIADPVELTVPDLDLGRSVDGIVDVELTAPGLLVVVTWAVADDGTEHRHLYELPVGPSEATDLGQDGVVGVEVDGGRLVTLTVDGELRVDGQPLVSGIEPGSALAVGHGRIAVSTSNQTDVYDAGPDDRVEVRSSPAGGWDAELVSPTTVVLTQLVGETASIVSLEAGAGEEPTTLVEGASAGMVVAADADVVFAAIPSADPEGPPRLVEQRLSR